MSNKLDQSNKETGDTNLNINKYPSFNTLLFFQNPKSFYRPILFSQNEIFCSPDCETEKEGDYFRTIKTPVGIFDVRGIKQKLSSSQKPELVVVKADAARRVFPVNLDQFNCPKLLIIGDTHHLNSPIQTLLNYAKEEKFDFVMTIPNPRHLHYFQEAGIKNTFWIPTFHIDPHPQQISQNYENLISFVGQARQFHPYRRYILDQVKEAGFSINQQQAPRPEAAKIYANSLISLNISLNGDLNMRVFEVLSSGGFLLTDRLSKQTRLNEVLEEGKHFVSYENETDLIDKITYYQNHPEEARKIAAEGAKHFWENYTPEQNVQRILDYMDGKPIEPYCYANWDKRSVYGVSNSGEQLTTRIALYEYIQEWHRIQTQLQGLCFPKVDGRVISDLVDLPRLNLYLLQNQSYNFQKTQEILSQCEVIEQVFFTDSPSEQKWDFIALSVADINDRNFADLINTLDFRELLVTDSTENLFKVHLLDQLLASYGLIPCSQNPLVYKWSVKEKLKLRQVNLIIFPDWNQPEEDLLPSLGAVMEAISNHPDLNQLTLVIDTDNLSEEDANLMLSGVAMSLLMEKGVDLNEEIEIALTASLNQREWGELFSHLHGRLSIEKENQRKISQLKIDQFPLYKANSLIEYQVTQAENGAWEFRNNPN